MNKSNKNKLQTYIAHMEYKVQVYDKGIKDGEAWVKVDVSSKTFIDHLRNFLTHTNTITADIDRLTAENAAWKAEKQSLLHHWGIEMNDVRHQGEQLTSENEKLKGAREIIETLKGADNEGTGSPYWLILDPSQMFRLDPHVLAGMIDGPFFCREDAQAQLEARRYDYSDRAVVYCCVVKIIASPTPEMMGREMAKKLNEKEKG